MRASLSSPALARGTALAVEGGDVRTLYSDKHSQRARAPKPPAWDSPASDLNPQRRVEGEARCAVDTALNLSGQLILNTGGSVSQTAKVTAANLSGSSHGKVTLNKANAIARLGPFNTFNHAFVLTVGTE